MAGQVISMWREEFDRQDVVSAALRVVSLAFLVAYVAFATPAGSPRLELGACVAAFLAYSAVLYLLGWMFLPSDRKWVFYMVTAVLDFAFVAVLMGFTGGADSPFFRALYLWVAMLAFFFGLKGGITSSIAAFLLFAIWNAGGSLSLAVAWSLAVQAGWILLHGPVVGLLAERDRTRSRALQLVNRDLAEANRRFIEEEAKVIQAEKLSSLGLLAAGVAHEINNPLMGVMGCVKALGEGSVPPGREDEYFSTARDGLERIGATVRDLLEFSREQHSKPVEVDLHNAVAVTSRLLGPIVQRGGVQLANRIEADAPRVISDRSQLLQAILNVLLNAVQATPPGGSIAVSAERAGARVAVRIADTGCGIAPDNLSRVCDPFFTTKPEGQGTGLGLAITLGIAKAQGGDLTIESTPDQGTVVTLWLPAAGATLEVARA